MSHERVEMVGELLDLLKREKFHISSSPTSSSSDVQERVPLSQFLDRLKLLEEEKNTKQHSKKLLIWNDLA
jgi:hypothetical protein